MFANNNYGLNHTYAEEGLYVPTIDVWDTDTPPQGSTTSGWQGSSQSTSMELQVMDAPLTDYGGGFDFDPNTTWSGIVGTFQDNGGVADMNEYSLPTINWGDGTSSQGTLEQVDGDRVNIMGSHTYAYQTTDTGEIARPLWMYGEQADYPIQAHVDDAGGSSVDLMWTAHAHLGNWIRITDSTSPVNNNVDPAGYGPPVATTVHISISAVASATGGAPSWYKLVAEEDDRNDSPTPITATGGFTVTPTLIVGAFAGTAAAGPGRTAETITITWTAVTAGTRLSLSVTDGTAAQAGVVTLIFDP
jgi:hypothetical protein